MKKGQSLGMFQKKQCTFLNYRALDGNVLSLFIPENEVDGYQPLTAAACV
jgi:hypothetical protein